MKTTRIHALLITLLFTIAAWAQTNPYGIYPVPHQTQTTDQSAFVAETVNIIAENGIDDYTRERATQVLEEHGKTAVFVEEPLQGQSLLRLGVQGSLSAPNQYDRHFVSIQRQEGTELAEILIVGENTDAAFYGLASLEQILDANADTLVCGEIQDYADVKNRGIIEGYYGVPYSAEVTKDLFRFMARYKLNMYMYGAKSDPYHSQKWDQAYPTSITAEQRRLGYLSQSMLRDITKVAHQCKVNFIWAIHPGSAFTNASNTTVVSKIMTKFQNMYRLGVRQFGICVDDVGIPTDDAILQLNADRITEVQNHIDQRWNKEGAAPADTVKPLNVVPQVYNFNQSTEENRQKFYNALRSTPAKVDIHITGTRTWSVPNTSDLQKGKNYLGRKVAWWWNYPCNDQDVTKLFPLDTYSNFNVHPRISGSARLEANLQDAMTIIINPMQQGEVLKIALFSVGNYTWNTAAFDNMASWEAALPAVVGQEHAAALRRLAPYLCYFDASAFSTLATRFKTALGKGNAPTEAMQTEIQDILAACQDLHTMETSDTESDQLFYKDVRPWLLELEAMAQEIAKLSEMVVRENDDAKWEGFVKEMNDVDALGTDSRFAYDILTGMGSSIRLSTRYAEPAQEAMMPFVEWFSENALGIEYFTNLNDTKASLVGSREDMSGTAYYLTTSGSAYIKLSAPVVMKQGDYVGISLPDATRLEDIAVADTLWEHYEVLWSANGKLWTDLQRDAPLPAEHIKYVVFLNASGEERVLALSKTEFSLTLPVKLKPQSATTPQCSAGFYDGHTEKYIIDGDYSTWTCIRRNQEDGDAYTVRLRKSVPINDVRICMGTVNGDYMTAGLVQLSEDGNTWESIPIMGTTDTNYTLTNEHNVVYNDEMTYCDFDGQGKTARYVRLYLSTPNTSNWLRLYEIEVNGRLFDEAHQGLAVDAAGLTIPELADADGATGYAPKSTNKPGEVLWNLRSQQCAKALTVYQDGGKQTDAKVSVTTDGEEWNELGSLAGYVARFDLTAHPFAIAAKISWTSKAPLLYEITEETDTATADVTSIGKCSKYSKHSEHSDSSEAWYDLSGRKVKGCKLSSGIYIHNGKKEIIR